MTPAAYEPPWMPPWATPGVGWPSFHGCTAASPTTKISGWPGHGQVGLDEDPTVAVGLGAGGLGDAPPERRGEHAGGPQHGARRDDLLGCALARVGGHDADGALVDVGDPRARADGDPEPLELAPGRGGPVGRVRRQDPVHRLDEDDPWRRPG